MKKILILLVVLISSVHVFSQGESPYKFKTVKENSSTEVKDQCRTGTCWSFSTTSFIESELIRMGKGEHNISEMYNVRMTYPKKAEYYIRFQGKTQFSAGSLSHDVMNVIEEYGMIPDEFYSGLDERNKIHDHSELDMMMVAMVEAAVKNKLPITEDYSNALGALLDSYLGTVPENFTYQGKKYTPLSFRDEMGLNPDDYVTISSFSHHPFGEDFVLEVPDNFAHESVYNVPLDELYDITKRAIEEGYTVAWDADVSEKGFSFRNGVAIVPKDQQSKEEMFKNVVEELNVTQENRQMFFDNFQTTDDHLMHLTGIAKDQNGKNYFIMKNSWGTENPFGGKQYVSESYFKLKTICVMLHKDALPKDM